MYTRGGRRCLLHHQESEASTKLVFSYDVRVAPNFATLPIAYVITVRSGFWQFFVAAYGIDHVLENMFGVIGKLAEQIRLTMMFGHTPPFSHPPDACTWQGAASVIQTDALGDSQEIAHLDMGHYFGEVRNTLQRS